jgi:hypothetical protein
MKRSLQIALAAAAFAATLGTSSQALAAGDIAFINPSSTFLHPYFRSNCWSPAFGAVPNADGWVFFGGVLAHSQFTWTAFQDILDPACKKPKIDFAYSMDGTPPPAHPARNKIEKIRFNPLVDYVITVVDNPVIQRPADEDDDD